MHLRRRADGNGERGLVYFNLLRMCSSERRLRFPLSANYLNAIKQT